MNINMDDLTQTTREKIQRVLRRLLKETFIVILYQKCCFIRNIYKTTL